MKRNLSVFITLILVALNTSLAQSTSEFFNKADALLSTHVKEGRVAYEDLKANPALLDELLDMGRSITVSKQDPATYKAFWINAYNLLVIKGIVANYPVKSPLDIQGFFDKNQHDIGGTRITLNAIENELLRANFPEEARFHFVLVCAGLGCPPIINEVYSPDKLEQQLQTQTEKALNDPDFIMVNKNKVKVSQIFEWYREDFVRGGRSLVKFINHYKKDKLPENAKISYYPYDWTLNSLTP